MKTIYLIFTFFLLYTLPASAQITVDADLTDWGDTTLRYEDKENKLRYDYRQDENFLYIAIFKNDNAPKASVGGVQLYLDKGKITNKSFMITFAYWFSDPDDPNKRYSAKDYIQLDNFQEKSTQLVPIYNEYGITAVYDYLKDESHLKDKRPDGQIELSKIGKNKSIFRAEVSIPKALLPQQADEILMKICLRGIDFEKTGNAFFAVSGGITIPKTIYEREINDQASFTEFTTKIKIE